MRIQQSSWRVPNVSWETRAMHSAVHRRSYRRTPSVEREMVNVQEVQYMPLNARYMFMNLTAFNLRQ